MSLNAKNLSAAPLVLAVLLFIRPVLAEEASPPTAAEDHDRFCRDHWLAMDCRDRPWRGPEIVLGLSLGVAAMNESGPFGFGNGVGSVTQPGPAWGLRAGVELVPWLALEARYVGASDAAKGSVSPSGSVAFLTTAGEAIVRLTAPLPYVHPYVLGGVGYYDLAVVGSSAATAGSVLRSSSQPGIPLGVGVDVPLTWHLSVALEATYHFQLGESLASVSTNNVDGGDISTFDAVARLRL